MTDRFRREYAALNDAQTTAIDRIKALAETMEALCKDTIADCPERPEGERKRLAAIGTTELEKAVSMFVKALT